MKLQIRTKRPPNKLKTFKLQQYTIFYNNTEAFDDIYDTVFIKNHYSFKTTKKTPCIIDAGANIGIATLYFKMQYPDARITCFEPEPNTYSILQKNILSNHLENVSLIKAALSKQEGSIKFYGEVDGSQTDSRGNSIIPTWGNQRDTSRSIQVMSKRLSSYIHEDIDFLKIDIEGAEQQVLEDLETTGKLRWIKELVVEVHEAENMAAINCLNTIVTLLKRNGFIFKIIQITDLNMFPYTTAQWMNRESPKIYILRAKNSCL